eukprot:15482363-Alexandrium_andersonii.AAC.1
MGLRGAHPRPSQGRSSCLGGAHLGLRPPVLDPHTDRRAPRQRGGGRTGPVGGERTDRGTPGPGTGRPKLDRAGR